MADKVKKAEVAVEGDLVVDETVVPVQMNVEITPTKTFKCCIGGTRYEFTKGVKKKVSKDVEAFLAQRDLIK